MRYIVIGGSGFVGLYTIRAILDSLVGDKVFDTHDTQKSQVICMDVYKSQDLPDEVEFVYCDIAKGCSFRFLPSDIVIHLAARAYAPKPPRGNLEQYFREVNVQGTRNIVETMLAYGCKNLVYFSTDMVYGKPQYLPVDCNHQREPFGWYGRTKVDSENLIFAARDQGLHATIFRPRIIVGAGRYGILTKLFTLVRHSLPVPMIGNGKNCYQMISVKDCAQAIVCAINKGIPNAELNLGSYNPPSIRELLSKLIAHAHSKSFLVPTYAKGMKYILAFLESVGMPLMYREQYMIADEQYIVDIQQTIDLLEWQPQESDTDMLFEAYNEYILRFKS